MYIKKDIKKKLTDLGLTKGDSVICSTSFGMLGMPKFKFETSEDLSKIFYKLIKEIIGSNGSIFAPTYSYSFSSPKLSQQNIFDVEKTPSKVGPFGEYIRNKSKSLRSIDPMISITGIGKDPYLLKQQKLTSYGNGCIFEKLLTIKKLKILNIGVGGNYIPFIHYVDHLNKCKHRYDKYFNGYIIKNNKKIRVQWHYPVPYMNKNAVSDGHKIAKKAINVIIKSDKLGDGKIYISNYRKLFDFSLKMSKKNTWVTAVGPKFK